ncbi:MAG: hypothetical protein IJV03_03135 [Alphaproteobacteria bacterium]|nr:hypothetical protein [Alphaproteobacteria bacterium]
MKNIIKTLGFLTAIATVCSAEAATSRVGVAGKATSRLPSIAGYAVATGTVVTTTGTTSASTLLNNAECIDSYVGCLKGADACGGDFEECTTNVLLHAKMPSCLSILSQCSASGINDLFGTSAITALANVSEKNTYGEVTKYAYPTDGSVLGQMVTGAKISNMYDTSQCVKKYQNCLKKDNVCGAYFELCTTTTEFKKQSIYCASTLARCQSDGVIELYGSTNTSAAPAGASRLGVAISEGAALAAVNAVSTCYRVADQCILNACGSNPVKCMADKSGALAKLADSISEGTTISAEELANIASMTSNSDVAAYIKNSCMDSIGGNKYCYATFIGNGQMPTNAQLRDEDNRDEIVGEAYSARMNAAMKQKIQDLANKFDTKAKDKCLENIRSCAMRSCGSGVGSVCYSLVFGDGGENTINGKKTYEGIKTGCEAIINSDSNCQYAAANANNNLYTYTYTDNSVFSTLFPEYEVGGKDPIGAIASLNASLSTSYNDAAIAQMKKQCANVAVSCVKSMCGKDYTNCYRNRTDVLSNTYDTGAAGFDKSMNKVGGVLDYTIVTGLCINTVKNADVCDEHLKIESVKLEKDAVSSWGDSVRGDWLGAAGSISAKAVISEVTIGCRTLTESENCDPNAIEACDYVDADGCLYDQKVTQSWTDYSLTQSANNLFQEVLMDIEKEAQAKYNAKLTKEQNICLSNNNGGIMGALENGSTFMWVKLKSNKIPKDYAMKGLQSKNFVTSNDLYGSFCRARITVTSDDKAIQDALGDKATAYFAVGDAFTCGSWIDQKTLDNITKAVGEKARKDAGEGSTKEKIAYAWATIGGGLGGGALGFFGMDALQRNGGSLGGLLDGKGIKQTKSDSADVAACLDSVLDARAEYNSITASDSNAAASKKFAKAVDHANRALRSARSAGIKPNVTSFKMASYTDAVAGTESITGYHYTDADKDRILEIIEDIKSTGGNQCGNDCEAELTKVESILNETPTSTSDRGSIVTRYLKNARYECNNKKDNDGKCKNITIPSLSLVAVADKEVTGADAGSRLQEDTYYTTTFLSDLSTLEKHVKKQIRAKVIQI